MENLDAEGAWDSGALVKRGVHTTYFCIGVELII
jgi:hypothetical protein